MKKALVLGVGNAQVDLIRYLKEEGWWVIGCSYRHEGRGLKLVDQFELVDICDFDRVESLARSQNVELIYSTGSDLAVPTIAQVSSKLGLPAFVDYDTIHPFQNKVLLRDVLCANNISPVKYRMVRSQKDLDSWNCFPAIIKPSDNQGQRGVYMTDSMHDVRMQFDSALSMSRSGTIIIEEYLDGPEISVNAFVVDGEVMFNEVSDRLVVEGYSGGIPKSHVLPAKTCLGELLVETKELVARCIRALTIVNGPVYFQMKLTSKGPRMIEITPRLDGCHMWRLIRAVGGVDLLDASVKLLTGDRSFDLIMKRDLSASHLNFLLCPPGREFKLADHTAPDGILHVEYYYDEGETVRTVNGLLEKVGYYIERDLDVMSADHADKMDGEKFSR